jgi:uncharacterized protein YdiU (UPF0061 family)
VLRETALPGAVLTRVAASHIRVGTFQYIAAQCDTEALRRLADYVIARHYPEAAKADQPYRALLDAVVARQADLVARWLLIGFIHGVMNTDNTSISGETIDYGPCAFMDDYDPATVFSSIDHLGRYAYANQPNIAQWNLARLAETLLPLLAENEAKALAAAADFTLSFRLLCAASADTEGDAAVRALLADGYAYDAWAARWRRRMMSDTMDPDARGAAMRAVNPAYIPRNHLIEAALDASVSCQDFAPFEQLLEVLSRPFDERPGHERYAAPPAPGERVQQTFCGT